MESAPRLRIPACNLPLPWLKELGHWSEIRVTVAAQEEVPGDAPAQNIDFNKPKEIQPNTELVHSSASFRVWIWTTCLGIKLVNPICLFQETAKKQLGYRAVNYFTEPSCAPSWAPNTAPTAARTSPVTRAHTQNTLNWASSLPTGRKILHINSAERTPTAIPLQYPFFHVILYLLGFTIFYHCIEKKISWGNCTCPCYTDFIAAQMMFHQTASRPLSRKQPAKF